jgi:ABC-type polysaccharide/polyol phosphate transport system ATPase subunit
MSVDHRIAIVARNVGIEYDLRLTHRRTLRQVIGETIHMRERSAPPKFWALEDVTFVAERGDVIGIVGRNGAGKSTLLLAIAGILKPDRGVLKTFGRTSTLLTLGAGFDEDLTGRQNIFLNGAFLGFSRARLQRLVPAIVEFSGLGEFIDVPLRKYSAGMRTRLGFSIAAHVEPEILLLDEVLGVGDDEFRRRSRERIFELMEAANAIVIVSHDLNFIEQTCTKALWLNEGRTIAFGDPRTVTQRYAAYMQQADGVVRPLPSTG